MLDDKTLEKWKVMLDTVEGEDNPMEVARILCANPELVFSADFGGPRVSIGAPSWIAAGMRPSWPRPYVYTAGTVSVDVVVALVYMQRANDVLSKKLAAVSVSARPVTVSGHVRDPDKRIMVISMVRAVTGLSLSETMALCEGMPTKIRADHADILRTAAFVSYCTLDITTHE